MKGEIKLIYIQGDRCITGLERCSLTYYSIEQRRAIIKTWQELYGDIIIQIAPKV